MRPNKERWQTQLQSVYRQVSVFLMRPSGQDMSALSGSMEQRKDSVVQFLRREEEPSRIK